MEHQGFSLGSISKGDTQKWNSLLHNLLDHSARFAQCLGHIENFDCKAGPAVAAATDLEADPAVVVATAAELDLEAVVVVAADLVAAAAQPAAQVVAVEQVAAAPLAAVSANSAVQLAAAPAHSAQYQLIADFRFPLERLLVRQS